MLSIRRFGGSPLRIKDMVAINSATPEMLAFLAACVKAKLNCLISGGTGTGKTTMLNALSSFIPEGERVVTIEDAAELQLQQRHVVRLETRPPTSKDAARCWRAIWSRTRFVCAPTASSSASAAAARCSTCSRR